MTLAWAGNWSGYLAEIGLQMASWLHCILQKRSNCKSQRLGRKKSNAYLPNHTMLAGSRYTVAPKSKMTDKTLLRWVQWKISLTYYLSSWIIASVWCYVWKRLHPLNCISRPLPIGFHDGSKPTDKTLLRWVSPVENYDIFINWLYKFLVYIWWRQRRSWPHSSGYMSSFHLLQQSHNQSLWDCDLP